MLLDVGYVVDNVDLCIRLRSVLFLAILAVARIVIRETRSKGLYEVANFSLKNDLILFFMLRVKIRCDRKRLDCITLDKMWVYAASLDVQKKATLKSSFPPLLPAYGLGLSGPHLG